MRAATFWTMTSMGWVVLALGCRDGGVVEPAPRQTINGRTTTIRAPIVAPETAEPLPSSAPRNDSEPGMSIPPVEEELEAPASDPAPAGPRAPPSQHQDRCGRPLVAQGTSIRAG